MSSAFASFHLTIAAPHGDRYPVTARTQAGHEVSEDLLLPLDDPTLTVYQMALDYHSPIDESVVIAVGQLFYHTLFQGTIAEAFATARAHADQQKVALRIQLAIDTDTRLSAAAALPWELMATAAGRPLMMEHALVRTFPWNDPIPDLGIPLGERIRLAVTSALPTELANHPIAAEAEVEIIRAAITHSSRPIDLIPVPHLTRERLTDLLTNERPHIVHHIGHGSIQRGMGYLDIERADQSRDRLSAHEFSSMLHQSEVQLVVLNACYTGSAGESLLTSFAPIFITDRIPAAIGMQAAILNRTGHCFANAFYATLGTGGSIDASLIAARKAILADGHEHGAWGFPTLYSRVPHGQLWGDRTPQPVDPLTQRDRERITKAAQQIESDRLLNLRLQGFVGRVNELAAIREQIAALRPTGGYVLIKAAAGEGKSSSIAKLVQETGIASTLHHFIALTTAPTYQLGLLRAVVAQLILKHHLAVSYFPEESYPAMKGEFARILDELAKQGIHETIYLDGLDQLQPESDGSRDLSFLPPQPPPGIVIVLGSRPDETLKPLEILHRADYDLPPLSEGDARTLWRSVQPAVADSLLHDLYAALKGNALFVHLAADTMRDQSLNDATSLIRQIEQNPSNLFGITLERMKGRSRSQWDTVWKPMLALLLVAQEPLRLDVLGDLLGHDHDTMQDAVWVLGGLVSQGIDYRIALHHLLFRDYLAGSVFNAREMKRWQQRLADWCAVDLNAIWADDRDLTEQARRMYARHHYVTHLALAENWLMLWQVLDAGDYGEQKTRFDPSTRLYALDLDRGREGAINAGQSTEEHIQNLPRLWKYSLLRTSLTSRVDQWPDTLFVVLAMLGRTQEALERIELLSDVNKQLSCWLKILSWCDHQQQQALITRLCEVSSHLKRGAIYTIANAMDTHGEREQALMILDHIMTIAQSIDDLWDQSTALCRIANAIAIHGEREYTLAILDHALTITQSIDDPLYKSNALATIVDAAATQGAIDLALTIAHTIDDLGQRNDAFFTIAKTTTTQGDIERALAIAQSIDDPSLRSSMLRIIAEAAATQGAIGHALTIAQSIDDPSKRSDALCSIANATAIHGQREYALAILNMALTIAQSFDNPWQRSDALYTIAEAAATQGAIDHALTIAQSIDDPSKRSDALCSIAHATATHGDKEYALAIFNMALTTAQSIEDPSRQSDALYTIAQVMAAHGAIDQALTIAQSIDYLSQHRRNTLYIIAHATATNGAIDHALTIAQSIDHPSLRSSAFLTIAEITATHGQREYALAILNMALNPLTNPLTKPLGILPHSSRRNTALYTIAEATTAHGAIDYAVTIAQSIDDLEQQSYILYRMANATATQGAIGHAIAIAQSIDYPSLRSSALDIIAEAAATQGAIGHAIVQSIDNPSLRSSVLRIIAEAAATQGDIERALAIAQSIDDPSQRSAALCSIANATAAHDQREYTLAILNMALTIAQSIDDPSQRSDILYTIAEATATHGAIDHALTIAQSVSNIEQRTKTFHTIAKAAATQGAIEHALTIAQSIDNPSKRSNAFLSIAHATATHGDKEYALAIFNMALTTAQSIEDQGSQFYNLCSIVQAAATQGAIDHALTIAQSIDDPSQRDIALYIIAKVAATQGAIDHVLTITQSIGDPWLRSGPLSSVATHSEREHALVILNMALTIAQSIDYPSLRSSALYTIAEAMVSHGAIDQALAITQSINDIKKRVKTFHTIAEAMASHGAIDQALAIAQSINDIEQRVDILKKIVQIAQSNTKKLAILQNTWFHSTIADDLWDVTSLIIPLIKEYPWMGASILEEEPWVNAQLKRLG